jgi:flagellar hook-associated protein 1
MGLSSSLQIGHSALTASQLAIQVTGHNLANIATPGFTRQTASLAAARGSGHIPGMWIGGGVQVRGVRREVDEALLARLRGGISSEHAAAQSYKVLAQIEASLNEMSGLDVSTELGEFFKVWSEGGNLTSVRSSIIQRGEQLASFMQRLRGELGDQRRQVDAQLGAAVKKADALLDDIARLNHAVSEAELGGGGGTAGALRDQRDQLLAELSQLIDATAVEQPSGAVNVLVGSSPVVLGGQSRGLELIREVRDGQVHVAVATRGAGGGGAQELAVKSGSIGAMMTERTEAVDDTIAKLDTLAARLVFEVNRLHSTGTRVVEGVEGFTSVTGTFGVDAADRGRAFNDPANRTFSQLPFGPVNGGFLVHVNEPGGATRTVRIDVNLDGINASGQYGFQDDTSLETLAASLDQIDGLSATITPDGRLNVQGQAGVRFSFAEDTSGILAALGMNSFFTGTSASDIAVRGELKQDPSLLAIARIEGGEFIENGTALGIADLQDKALGSLGGRSLIQGWTDDVASLGARVNTASGRAQATMLVREGLEAQRAATSGVSADEEAINLMNQQRAYQGAARYIAIVDEMMQTLMAIL